MNTPISKLPGAKPLVVDYFDNFEKVSDFYNGDYRQPENFLNRADEIKARDLPLAQLVPILKEQNQTYGCGLQTLEKIDWLLERRACAVVTGQQTGLFGGPLFTVYKALTAIKLAERLSRTCEGCHVPIFWLASDDHDFREVNHINILDKNNQPARILYDGHPADSRLPVAAIKLTDSISAALEQLDSETHPSDFKEAVMNRLRDAYQPGAAFSTAFAKWLTALFEPFGLIIIDASDARIKALAKSLFRDEIAKGSPSTQAVLAASTRLREHGYHNQVPLQDGFLNLFHTEQERNAIAHHDGQFTVKNSGATFSESTLLDELEAHPEFFSPNVMLRPLYQDALLPTIAYVAGTGEGAYYAQMKGIYESFGIPMPVIYPRKSLTLLEGKIAKILGRYDLSVRDFWQDGEQLLNAIAKAQLPESLEQQIEATLACFGENLEALQQTVAEFDPTLIDFIKNTRGRIEGQIDGMRKKTLQAFKKRNEVMRQQILKGQNSLFPNRHLQERELNVLPYLFKYGFGFIDKLYEAIDISSFEHQVVEI